MAGLKEGWGLPKKKWGWGEETIKIRQVSRSFFFYLDSNSFCVFLKSINQ